MLKLVRISKTQDEAKRFKQLEFVTWSAQFPYGELEFPMSLLRYLGKIPMQRVHRDKVEAVDSKCRAVISKPKGGVCYYERCRARQAATGQG